MIALFQHFNTGEENSATINWKANAYDAFTVFDEMTLMMVLFVIVPLSMS